MSYEGKDIVTLSQGRAFREKIGMYLSGDRQEAINLGLRELIVNTQDEYEVYKPKNPFLKITIDTVNRVISVEDNMRGIPVAVREDGMNSLTAAMLINHSGGKHAGTAYESSVGINGCGNKIVNHTAKWLEVEVHRDGKIYTQRFESDDEGAHEVTKVLSKKGNNTTGTKITYCPDEKVYGTYFIELDKLRQMLQELSYFSKGLRISLQIDDNNEEIFQSKNGLIDGLDNKNAISKPFRYEYKTDNCEVELALQWVKKRGKIRGYANGLYMPDGGAFISGFKSSLTRTFNNLANSKFDGDTIRSVLDGFVSVKVKVGQFSNQAKTALANPEARTATSTAITEALKQFTTEHTTEFNNVVAMLEKLEKAEAAATKAREAIMNHEKEMAAASKHKTIHSEKLREARKLGQDSMLILVEGNSAGGSVATGRQKAPDGDKIGILKLRGKMINALANPIEDVLANEEIKLLLQALGLVYGQKYNSKKLRYGKVAICSDADFDGSHIGLLIMAAIQKLCPEFIEEGRLYWLKAPTSKLDNKGKTWYYYNDDELKSRTQKEGNITFFKGLGQMDEKDLRLSLFGANQHLEQLSPTEDGIVSLLALMGNDVEPRKDFVQGIDFGGFQL